MSLYQLHRAVYDWIRAGEVNSDAGVDGRVDFDLAAYELTGEEQRAFTDKDVGAMYQLGLHEVLINRYARAAGFARDDYRKILEQYAKPEERRGRWQR